jgi:hypothetical protein
MVTAKTIPPFSETNFWKRVDKTAGENACWPWTGSLNNGGYGQVNIGGSNYKSHRVALHLTEPVPSNTLYACHTCDNSGCCNPKHLYWGTAKSNTGDRDTRGRRKGPLGIAHHKAKLTPEKVREIRRLAGSMTQRELATKFEVAQGVIWNIIHRKFWKEVDD